MYNMNYQPTKWIFLAVRYFVIFIVLSSVSAKELKSCPGQRFRSYASELQKIRDCDIIEGNLIMHFSKGSEADWKKYGNLPLTEITGFLIIYSVSNIYSLDVILPNLTVIRGHELFDEYALVIYLMPHLQVVNLPRLTNILHGTVYINRNPKLTYLSTVNFKSIIKSKSIKQYIQSDSNIVFSGTDSNNSFSSNGSELTINKEIYELQQRNIKKSVPKCNSNCERGFCWTQQNCQNLCQNCFLTDTEQINNQTCHIECVGGCTKVGDSGCVACKNFRYNSRCLKQCGDYLYEWDAYKCVEPEACHEKGRYIYSNKCVKKCPQNYQVMNTTLHDTEIATCHRSPTYAPCDGGLVSSLGTSEKFQGCRVINGSLYISLSHSAIENLEEINKNLNEIEEIFDFLYISDSTVRTLTFLKNLKVIKGRKLLDNKYSFLVRDCPNLQNLWEPSKGLIVENGKIRFYRNPKLCCAVIKRLLAENSWENFLYEMGLEKIRILNGYDAFCNTKKITVETEALNRKGVMRLFLPPIETKHLYGYIINYIEDSSNMTHTNKSDVDDSWTSIHVAYDNEADNKLWKDIENLKPATRYAFFVTSVIVPSATTYHSDIFYATTKRFNPNHPENIYVEFEKRKDIEQILNKEGTFHWTMPKISYGKIDFYHIEIIPIKASLTATPKGYCNNEAGVGIQMENITKNAEKPRNQPGKETNVSSQFSNYLSKMENDQFVDKLAKYILFNETLPADRFKRNLVSMVGKEYDYPNFEELFGDNADDYFEGNFHNLFKSPSGRKLLRDLGNEGGIKDKNILPSKKNFELKLNIAQPIGDESNAPSLHCSNGLKNGIKTSEPEYTCNLNNSRYLVKIRACHNMTNEVYGNLMMSDNTEECFACSVPYEKELCILLPDVNVKVQNIVVKNLNNSTASVTWDKLKLPIKGEDVHNYNVYLKMVSSAIETSSESLPWCVNSTETKKNIPINHPGTYSIRVAAQLQCFNESKTMSNATFIHINPIGVHLTKDLQVYLPITIVSVLILICIAIIIWRIIKGELEGEEHFNILNSAIYGSGVPRCESYLPKDMVYPWKNLKLLETLGEGNFGLVKRGILRTKDGLIDVAVKKLKRGEPSWKELCTKLVDEATIIFRLRSFYLVQTYGLVSHGYDLYLVMELMSNGTLKTFLENRRKGNYRDDFVGSERHLLRIALQIADGMFHLESQKIIHRDLAARNCLMDANYNAKISDFGMSRIMVKEYYRISTNQKVPLRRMPPEYFNNSKLTSKSDIWCYGILLWELCIEKDAKPYDNFDNIELEIQIGNGKTLSTTLPVSTPIYFSTVMNQCWKKEPQERPSFEDIIIVLLDNAKQYEIGKEFREKSYKFCGEMKEVTYSSMTSTTCTTSNNFDETELSVRTPLTMDCNNETRQKKERFEEQNNQANLSFIGKTRSRLIQFRKSILFSKIFPFNMSKLRDDSKRVNGSGKNSLFTIV